MSRLPDRLHGADGKTGGVPIREYVIVDEAKRKFHFSTHLNQFMFFTFEK